MSILSSHLSHLDVALHLHIHVLAVNVHKLLLGVALLNLLDLRRYKFMEGAPHAGVLTLHFARHFLMNSFQFLVAFLTSFL